MADTNKTLVFSAERGFHVHRDVWKPLENKGLEYLFERHNIFDMFAVKTCCLEDGQMAKFLLDRGTKVTVQLTGTHYRRSPLFQGGLEISCLVPVTSPGSIKGHMLVQRYQQMAEELYCVQKEEVIMGSIFKQIVPTEDEPRVKKKKKTSATKKTEKSEECKDIRSFFQNAGRPPSNKDSKRTIVID